MPDDYDKIKNDIEEKFVSIVKESYGKELLSLMLYGSAAQGTYKKDISDVNILIILQSSNPAHIQRLGKAAGGLIRKHRISPLIMTRSEFKSAADVFPMEYYDIRDSHRLIYGGNETAGLYLTMTNLRHQLEERLRGAVNDLRHMLISSEGSKKKLGNYLKSWPGVQNALFRGLLRLKNVEHLPNSAEALLEQTARHYGIPTSAFTVLNDHHRGGKVSFLEVAKGLLEDMKALVAAVDTVQG